MSISTLRPYAQRHGGVASLGSGLGGRLGCRALLVAGLDPGDEVLRRPGEAKKRTKALCIKNTMAP